MADREWIYGANLSTVRQAAHLLGKFDPGNEAAIAALVEKIQTEDDEWRRTAAECLGIVDSGNEMAIATLVKEIQIPEDESCRRQALLSLSMNNITRWQIAVGTNLDILNSYPNKKRYLRAADSLRVIGRGNEKAIVALKKLVQATQDEYRRSQTLLRNCSEETLSSEHYNLYSLQQCCLVAAESLEYVDPGNQIALAALVNLIETFRDNTLGLLDLLMEAAEGLGKTDPGNEMAISTLVDMIQTHEDWHIVSEAFRSLVKIGIDTETAIATLVELIETSEDEDIRIQASEFLANIDPGNETAVATLIELSQTDEDDYIRAQAAKCLENIDPGNETAITTLETEITTLIELSKTYKDEFYRLEALEELRRISRGNATEIAFLLDLFQTAQNEDVRQVVAGNLCHILRGVRFPEAVTVLKNYLPLTDDVEPIEYHCEEAIWHCTQNMSYRDFHRAWHGKLSFA